MMWKLSATMTLISLLLATVQAEYTIITSNDVGSYHYPAPPKSQQLYEPASQRHHERIHAAPQVYHNQYQVNYYSAPLQHLQQQSAFVTRQFASPALDNAAFNLALTHQGYTFGGNRQPLNAALRASPRSSKTNFQTRVMKPSTSSSRPAIGSLNVKLPLPIGITPINIAPLPLQTGAPYPATPRGVTSYGTIYPQRRRR